MELKEFIEIICTVLSALFAGLSFKFYRKTLNIHGNYENNTRKYENINQQSGNGGTNIVGNNK